MTHDLSHDYIYIFSHLQDAENVYSKVCKKFSHMPEFWIGYGLCYFMQGNAEKARHTMQRAIKALPQTHRKYEYNHGWYIDKICESHRKMKNLVMLSSETVTRR